MLSSHSLSLIAFFCYFCDFSIFPALFSDFNNVIKHYIIEQYKITFCEAETLSDLFLDTRNAVVSVFNRLLDG